MMLLQLTRTRKGSNQKRNEHLAKRTVVLSVLTKGLVDAGSSPMPLSLSILKTPFFLSQENLEECIYDQNKDPKNCYHSGKSGQFSGSSIQLETISPLAYPILDSLMISEGGVKK